MARATGPVKPSQLSQEFIQDSSDEETDQGQPVAKTPTKKASSKQVEGKILAQVNGKPVTKMLPTTEPSEDQDSVDETSASSSTGSESGSESGDSEVSGESEASSATSSSHSGKKRSLNSKNSSETVQKKIKLSNASHTISIPPKPFSPPNGFEKITPGPEDYASEVREMFSDLTGKQVWHITAPSSLPINSIKTLDILAATRGEPILKDGKIEYNMHAASAKSELLLLPHSTNLAYSQAEVQLSRNFRLREMTDGKMDMASEAQEDELVEQKLPVTFSAQAPGTKAKPRKQPKGLRMRYTPFGAKQPRPEQSSTLKETETESFRIPDDIEEVEVDKATKQKKSKYKRGKSGEKSDKMDMNPSAPTVLPTSSSSEEQKRSSQTGSQTALQTALQTGSQGMPEGQSKPREKKRKKRSRLTDEL